MKNFIYIITLCMLSSVMAACSNDTNNASLKSEKVTLETKETNTTKDDSAVHTEGKTKKDTVSLKEKSLFQFEAEDGNFKYNVFLFAENEQQLTNEEDGLTGKKGDPFFTGQYSVYLGEKDATVAYKQDVLKTREEFTFNPSLEQVYTLKLGEKSIIVILQQDGPKHSKVQLLAVKDGEIKEIQSVEEIITVTETKMKVINQNYLQTALFTEGNEPSDGGWVFSTWKFDDKSLTVSKHDQSDFNNEDREASKDDYWYDLWKENENHYFPYVNLVLNKDVIEKAKQGIPIGSPYPIGTNISEIKKTNPYYMEEGYKNEVPYIMYPEITYYFEQQTGNVTSVSIPGQRMKMTINEIKNIFGTPLKEGENVESKENFAIYTADKYLIKVTADEGGNVKSVYLSKK